MIIFKIRQNDLYNLRNGLIAINKKVKTYSIWISNWCKNQWFNKIFNSIPIVDILFSVLKETGLYFQFCKYSDITNIFFIFTNTFYILDSSKMNFHVKTQAVFLCLTRNGYVSIKSNNAEKLITI